MKTKITVTQDHIDAAAFMKGDMTGNVEALRPYISLCSYCPIALAFSEKGYSASVKYTVASVEGVCYAVLLPRQATDFILKFDSAVGTLGYEHSALPKPFSFYVDIP